jgi:hypothetical protein
MKFPREIQTRKGKLAYFVFKQLYLFDLGKNRVIGRPLSFIPEAGIIFLVADKVANRLGYSMPLWSLLILVAMGIGFSWTAGVIYYKLRLDQIETIVSQERNPLIKKIYDKVSGNGEKEKHF